MKQITEGNSTAEEFIAFVKSQKGIDALMDLEWANLPIWKVFLATDPDNMEMSEFLIAYKELGGDLFELDQYKRNVLYFRLERAKNSYALDFETVVQTFELAGNLAGLENRGKAMWEYCIQNEWEESEKSAALQRFRDLGGDCGLRGEYGFIFKYIAGVPSIKLWKLAASWIEVHLDDDMVVGGEGEARIGFCEFLSESQIPISHWGKMTFEYALRDDDLQLMDKIMELGWELDLDDPDIYGRAGSIEAYQKLLELGVNLNPDSTYPGDFPVYSTIYNLSGRIENYNESPQDYYLESIEEDKEILKLLLQYGARLDFPLEYDGYPPLASLLVNFPEIHEIVKAHADVKSIAFLEGEIQKFGA